MEYRYNELDKLQAKWFVEEFQQKLNLQNWKFEIRFSKKENYNSKSSSWICADIWVDPVYLKWNITLYPKLLEQRETVWLNVFREMIMHEMCHCLTEWLSNIAKSRYLQESEIDEECESLTQRIAILVLWDKNTVMLKKEEAEEVRKDKLKKKK
jgi:hypothetical protein